MIDLDNTLTDRSKTIGLWIAEFCDKWALPPSAPAWILDADNDGYTNRHRFFHAIREQFAVESPIDTLLADYQRNVIALASPAPGAVDCLASLRLRNWTTAIVTNGSTAQQHGKIDRLGFRKLVDGVCVSDDLGIKKPDAGIFEAAATQTGATLEGAWMVGDSPLHDIVGASRLGVKTVWVRRGRSWQEDLPAPDAAIDSLNQLVAVIEAHASAP